MVSVQAWPSRICSFLLSERSLPRILFAFG